MSSSIVTYRDKLDAYEAKVNSLQNRARSIRDRAESEAEFVQGVFASSAAAYLYGSYEQRAAQRREVMMTVAGLPPLLTYSVGAMLAGRLVSGRAGEILSEAGRGLLAVHAYKTGAAPRAAGAI